MGHEARTGRAVFRLAGTRAGWVLAIPEFEVLGSVVIANSVLMMHGLIRVEVAPQLLLHDQPMLEHTALVRVRVVRRPGREIAIGCPNERFRISSALTERTSVTAPARIVHLAVPVAPNVAIAAFDGACLALHVAVVRAPLSDRRIAWIAVLTPARIMRRAEPVPAIAPRSMASLNRTSCIAHAVTLS
jgi:hypothetical protein